MEKKMNPNFPYYQKKCELLQMFAIPYIGQYSNDYYNFLPPLIMRGIAALLLILYCFPCYK